MIRLTKLTLKFDFTGATTPHDLYCEIPREHETAIRKEGGEAVVMCASCGSQRGERVSTLGCGGRQPGSISPVCAKSEFSVGNLGTHRLQTPPTVDDRWYVG